jgi:hypothetical protein
MMTELILVEGVSDVQLISYYLQNVYGWKHEKSNSLGIVQMDVHDHIESLSKEDNQLVLCGVGGNGKFEHFIKEHRINSMLIERDIASVMTVTDHDEGSVSDITAAINNSFKNISFEAGKWNDNRITDSFGQQKDIRTYLLIVPSDKKGALESVIIDALKDIPKESKLIEEVIGFVDYLKLEVAPNLQQTNNANKAIVGTYFSVSQPKHALRSFAVFISKIDWSQSQTLKDLFAPFGSLGEARNRCLTL